LGGKGTLHVGKPRCGGREGGWASFVREGNLRNEKKNPFRQKTTGKNIGRKDVYEKETETNPVRKKNETLLQKEV